MGIVLRARDTKLERFVALKVLAAPLAASGTAGSASPARPAPPPPSAMTRRVPYSPLRGMALEVLSVAYCRRVTDLSPLRGMPLRVLWWVGAPVSDLSPLKGMPLKEIVCEFQRERDDESLRSLTTLETINGKSAAEFWKEVDGQQGQAAQVTQGTKQARPMKQGGR